MMAVLGSLASSLLPLAAKKLATIPLAQQVFKTITPVLNTVMPVLG